MHIWMYVCVRCCDAPILFYSILSYRIVSYRILLSTIRFTSLQSASVRSVSVSATFDIVRTALQHMRSPQSPLLTAPLVFVAENGSGSGTAHGSRTETGSTPTE